MLPDDGRVVSNFIVQALSGKQITIFGEGNQTRSFCYVSELVDGLMRLMSTSDEVTGPVNLGNPHELTILELADMVLAKTGSTVPLLRKPLPMDDPVKRKPDISRAKELLQWEPKIGLEEGLDSTITYFAEVLNKTGNIPSAQLKTGA